MSYLSREEKFEEARATMYEACSYVKTDDPRALPLAIQRYLKARQALAKPTRTR